MVGVVKHMLADLTDAEREKLRARFGFPGDAQLRGPRAPQAGAGQRARETERLSNVKRNETVRSGAGVGAEPRIGMRSHR